MTGKSGHWFRKRDVAAENEYKRQHKRVNLTKVLSFGLAALLIFGLGVNVGNGRLYFNGNQSVNPQLPNSLDFNSLNQVYRELRNNYDGKLDATKLLDGAKAGMVNAAGDAHTEYLNTDAVKEFDEQITGTFTGIGAKLGQDTAGTLQVIAPIDDTPAAKAGLRAQDLILAIDGTDTAGMSIETAVNKIRGPAGTTVKLDIKRGDQEMTLSIVRDNIKVPSVKAEVVGDIGYLQITQFSDDTVELTRKAAEKFKQAGVRGVVLDLRDNPGGLLDAAVNVSSLWLPKGKKIVQEKRDSQVIGTSYADGTDLLAGVPTAVLINGGSASASEIVAGALRDNDSATLIGAKTYGKGSVQTVLPLRGGAELKVTVARWYRPNGQNIDKKGIVPDKKVEMSEDDYKAQRDPQKDAAFEWLRSQKQ